MIDPDAIVIGAGLAGLSCAVNLVDKGKKVLVLEANEYLGGRTSSWNDHGMEIESGFHRVLGFYESFPDLLERCGVQVDDIVEWINEIEIRFPDNGPCEVLAISPVDKPVETIVSMLGKNDFISPTDKIMLSKFMVAGLKKYFDDPITLDSMSVSDLAKEHDLSKELIDRIITPFSTGLFFLPPEEYSAYVFFGTFGPYLKRVHKFREGAFLGGMSDIMINPIADYIERHGGSVRKNQPVQELLVEDGRISGVRTNSQIYKSSQVVLATDMSSAQKLIKKKFGTTGEFREFLSLPSMPALTIQFDLATPSHTTDRVVFSPTTALASYAEQSRTTFKKLAGRLSVIVANPASLISRSDEDIFEVINSDALRLGISLNGVKDFRIVRLPTDFYSLRPGNNHLRPSQKTKVPGLTLAGDYTQQKYLATMEGAVVSGQLAAEQVMR